MLQGWVGVAIVGVGVCVSQAAIAEGADGKGDPSRPPSVARGQENFGLGAELGFYNPNGFALRGGARAASLEVAFGFTPSLLSYGSAREPKLKFLAPLEVAPQLVFDIIEIKRELRGGLRVGYRYNWALGHGGSVGGQIGKRFGDFLVEGVGGITVYPNAAGRLRGDEVPANAGLNFPPALNWGVGVSIFFYP